MPSLSVESRIIDEQRARDPPKPDEVEVHIEDAGEPGSQENDPAADCPETGHAGGLVDCGCADFYSITIHATEDCGSDTIYHVWGYITGGNFQIHPPVGGPQQ